MGAIDIQSYIKDNPTAIVRGLAPLAEVIDNVKRETNAVDIPNSEIPNLRMHRFNAYHLPVNEALNLAEEQLHIKAIKIPITDDTRHYTAQNFVSMSHRDESTDDYIYLAYEEQVRYLYSNSNKLFLETILRCGISEEDIVSKAEEYMCYLFYLQSYLEEP